MDAVLSVSPSLPAMPAPADSPSSADTALASLCALQLSQTGYGGDELPWHGDLGKADLYESSEAVPSCVWGSRYPEFLAGLQLMNTGI